MSRIAYFDCFGGISGDMTLGALLDAGGEPALLESALRALQLEGEVRILTTREPRGHLSGLRVTLECGKAPSRRLPELQAALMAADLPDEVRKRSMAALARLGEAESRLHGVPAADLHLHELGGADTLVDLVGAFWLLNFLQVDCVYASELPSTRGSTGGLPLPAPAALEVLAGTGATWRPAAGEGETVTPTGAAILATCARFERPAIRVERTGYGVGSRPEPGNLLRVWLGQSSDLGGPAAQIGSGELSDEVAVLETNLDDMSPQLLAALCEDLMAAGALDVTVTPILMKKGRPGHLVTVLTHPGRGQELASFLLRASTSLGVRVSRTSRLLADRRTAVVASPYGEARVKLKELEGRPVDVAPEYEDCRRIAREQKVGVREVMRAVEEAARRELLS